MRRLFNFSICSFLAAGLLLLSGCEGSAIEATQQPPPATVIVSQPVEEPVFDTVDYTGRTDSAESVEIRSRVTGFLRSVLFKDGAEVAKDAPLYEIDDREFKATLEAALAELASATARQERATADFGRVEALRRKGVATAEQYDQAQAAKKDGDAAVQSAIAKRDRAQLDVDFSKIAAPIAGKISRSDLSVGNLVTANTTVLTTIVSVDPIYVYFDVDERTFLRLRNEVRAGRLESKQSEEIPVLMGLTGDKGYPHAGKLDFVENRINPNTGTLRVRAAFSNPKPAKGDRILEAGLFARIRVPIGKPKPALLVTDRAIGTDQGQKFVYVVDDKNKVDFRPVELGPMHEGLRVIAEGLKKGDRIIIDGLQRVRPGSVVDPQPGDMHSRPGGEAVAEATEAKAKSAEAPASKKAHPEHKSAQ